MNYKIINIDDKPFVARLEDDILIRDEQLMLDMLMTISYETGLSRVMIDKENLTEDFFKQKFHLLSIKTFLYFGLSTHHNLPKLALYSRYKFRPRSKTLNIL